MRAKRQSVPLLLPLLLLCLALRSAIPAGWMPSFEDGGATFIPCSGWMTEAESAPHGHGGQEAQASHHDAGGKTAPGKSKHDVTAQPCSFAAAAADLPSQFASISRLALVPTEHLFSFNLSVTVGHGLAAPPPPPTGPPLIS
jgi:hypothetical protein